MEVRAILRTSAIKNTGTFWNNFECCFKGRMGDRRAFFEAKNSLLDVIDRWLACFRKQLCQYFRSQLVMGVCNLPLGFGKFSKILGFLGWPLSHTLVVDSSDAANVVSNNSVAYHSSECRALADMLESQPFFQDHSRSGMPQYITGMLTALEKYRKSLFLEGEGAALFRIEHSISLRSSGYSTSEKNKIYIVSRKT